MPRIIGGTMGGRRLVTPAGERTRPTSDFVKEALFAKLTGYLGTFDGMNVLDLYAGSGALGLEAMSRGATSLTLVDSDRRALAAVRRNVEALGVSGVRIVAGSVERVIRRPGPDSAFGLVLMDPPYAVGNDVLEKVLDLLSRNGWISPGALVVLERAHPSPPVPTTETFAVLESSRYGSTSISILELRPGTPTTGP